MQSAVTQALEHAQRAGAKHVLAIRLRIGTLSGVVPDALEFAFEAVTAGTPAEGASLTVDSVPARFWCAKCHREFQSVNLVSDCPVCGTPSSDLRAGRELELASLEID